MTNVTAQPLDRCKATVMIDGNKKVCLITQGGIRLDRVRLDVFCQTSKELVQAVTWLVSDYGFVGYEGITYNEVHTDPAYDDVDAFLKRITDNPETLEEGFDGTITILVKTYPAESQLVLESETEEIYCEGLLAESIAALPAVDENEDISQTSPKKIDSDIQDPHV